MFKNVKHFYKKYGEYVIQNRMIPSAIDGLRLVERRILYSAYLVAKDKLKKSPYIVGQAVIMHPHGDSSIYGTLVKLCNYGLIDGQGNWGSKCGIEDDPPAAQRYTEAKLNSRIKKIAFDLIEYADFNILELEKEPVNLPTLIPLGLLFKDLNSTPAFGIKTTIPSYKLSDLAKRLLYLINYNTRKNIPKVYYGEEINSFANNNEYEKLLTTGCGQISFCPKLHINKQNKKIEIFSRPVDKKFTLLISALEKEISSGVISFIDKSTTSTNIEISIVKNKRYNFDNLVELVRKKLTSKITYVSYFLNQDSKIPEITPIDTLLLNSYSYQVKCLNSKLQDLMSKQKKKINNLEIILDIRPHIAKVIQTKNLSKSQILEYVYSKSKYSKSEVLNVIKNQSIEKLLYIKFDLEAEKNILKNLQSRDIKQEIIQDLKKLSQFK